MCFVSANVYGEGTYLAVYANYSHPYARATNEETTDKGNRHMYFCRCLTGDFVESKYGTKMAPPKDGVLMYDTTINGDECGVTPRIMFIVYDPDQIYPQYLITYRDGKYN